MKIVRFGCLVVVFSLMSCAKIVVTPVKTSTVSKGMIYALPKTIARIQIKLDRTERQGAPFAAYAAIFAPGGEVVCKDALCTAELPVSYSLQDGATISTYGVPDPDQIFLVEFSGVGAIDQTMSMTWNDAGLLSSAGASVTNRTTDVVMSGLKLASSFGAKGFFGSGLNSQSVPYKCPRNPSRKDHAVLNTFVTRDASIADGLAENYCEIEVGVRDTWQHDLALLGEATDAYVSKIHPLAAARADILIGTQQSFAPAQLIEKLDAEISRLLAKYYLGAKAAKTWEGTLDVAGIAPGPAKTLQVVRVNAAKGFCVMGGATVAPESKAVPRGFVELAAGATDCSAGALISLDWDYYPKQADQLSSRIKDDTDGDRSFRYRVPSQIKAELRNGSKSHAHGVGLIWVAQLGEVVSLPAGRRSKTLSYDLTFVESTGALKTFKLGSTGGLDAGTIDSLSTAGGTYLDAENARKAKRETATDELTILTREKDLLTKKDEICTLRKKYGQACADDAP